ncbi:MAG: spore germination protein [Oscillospiraceae bacterium]|nr:spore germination protein [Oscillospiraceae bacterium]MDD4413670.1 spore germination protein [Oscillospiraceae bacterium]
MRFLHRKLWKKKPESTYEPSKTEDSWDRNRISDNLDVNINNIKTEIGSGDLIINLSTSHPDHGIRFACVYIDNLISNQILSDYSTELGKILVSAERMGTNNPKAFFNLLINQFSSFRRVSQESRLEKVLDGLLSGQLVFLIDGHSIFLSIDAYSPEGRSVEEPTSQSIVRGPKEGFTEKLGINISLIRKRIKDKALKSENLTVGNRTKTKVTLMYINGLAKQEIIDEIRRRINAIQIDGILESGYIEELIKDNKYSIFPTFLNSEKPDSVAACLLEGKVAILVDGTPFVLTAPALFAEFFQASEDYYHQFHISTFVRLFRYVALALSMFVPSIYITLASFHQEMIPTPLLISMLAQREGVPFPTTVEVLLMEVVFEILREAGIRMPRIIGPAISIVGALVLGQAAVEAGIISAVIVIIVSITAISSFAIPNYGMANSARIVRFIMIFLARVFGLFGIFMGTLALLLELCRLKSIGVPYMSPFAPKGKTAVKDTILRFPLWKSMARPEGISADTSPRVSDKDIVTDKQKKQSEFR